MRFFILALVISFRWVDSCSQVYSKRFYDMDGDETDGSHSYYYKVWTTNPASEIQVISYYTKTNSLKLNEGIKDGKGQTLRTYYYPNGSVKSEGHFNDANPIGLIRSYYMNHELQSELFFEEASVQKSKNPAVGIINYWDSLGNQMIDNGKGFCNCVLTPFSDKRLFEKGLVVDGLKQGEWEGKV